MRSSVVVLVLLLLAGCVGGGGEKKETPAPPAPGAEGIASIELDPVDVVMMPGEIVDHDFVLKLTKQAPSQVRIQLETGDMEVKITPDPVKVVDGPQGKVASGRIAFAPPLSYPPGDHTAVLLVTDTSGKLMAKVKVDFYVLPPGAS